MALSDLIRADLEALIEIDGQVATYTRPSTNESVSVKVLPFVKTYGDATANSEAQITYIFVRESDLGTLGKPEFRDRVTLEGEEWEVREIDKVVAGVFKVELNRKPKPRIR